MVSEHKRSKVDTFPSFRFLLSGSNKNPTTTRNREVEKEETCLMQLKRETQTFARQNHKIRNRDNRRTISRRAPHLTESTGIVAPSFTLSGFLASSSKNNVPIYSNDSNLLYLHKTLQILWDNCVCRIVKKWSIKSCIVQCHEC